MDKSVERSMKEIKVSFYNRYLKLKLELKTLEAELELNKKIYNQTAYSGCKDVKAVDYSSDKVKSSNVDVDIKKFYENFVDLGKEITNKEVYKKELQETIKKIEKDFDDYYKNFNDIEMKVFTEHYVHQKPLNQIYILKNNGDYYSIRQIKRIKKKISEKLLEMSPQWHF